LKRKFSSGRRAGGAAGGGLKRKFSPRRQDRQGRNSDFEVLWSEIPKFCNGEFNRSMQHHLTIRRWGVNGPRLTRAQEAELWRRYKANQSLSDIARLLRQPYPRLYGRIAVRGGCAPKERRHHARSLSLPSRARGNLSRPECALFDPADRAALRPGCLEHQSRSAPAWKVEVSRA
jgi:hypothetical protein